MATYRILALDGGGVRGVLSATLLGRLAQARPEFLEEIDLFAGTSTGALIAAGLAMGMPPSSLRRLYEQGSAQIFKDSVSDGLADFGCLFGAKYDNEPLSKVLNEVFGDTRLGEVPRRLLVSTYLLDSQHDPRHEAGPREGKAKFFHNFPLSDGKDYREMRVADVLMRSSAAPVFFPTFQASVDGGVVANNPSMCALAQALHSPTGGQALADIRLLSVGTGGKPAFVDAPNADWGLAQWGLALLGVVFDGSVGLADYQCRQILGERYHRLDPRLPKKIGMDAISEVPDLARMGEDADIGAAREFLAGPWSE